MHVHIRPETQRALRDVQVPWPARLPNLSPTELGYEESGTFFSPEPATTIAEFRRVQVACGNLFQDGIGTFMTVCMRVYTPELPPGY